MLRLEFLKQYPIVFGLIVAGTYMSWKFIAEPILNKYKDRDSDEDQFESLPQ